MVGSPKMAPARTVTLFCELCGTENTLELQGQWFIELDRISDLPVRNKDVAIYEELRGLADKRIGDIWCPGCGTCGWLMVKGKPNTRVV